VSGQGFRVSYGVLSCEVYGAHIGSARLAQSADKPFGKGQIEQFGAFPLRPAMPGDLGARPLTGYERRDVVWPGGAARVASGYRRGAVEPRQPAAADPGTGLPWSRPPRRRHSGRAPARVPANGATPGRKSAATGDRRW
jgi:hypothetical protein